jgi:hypothetical protein
MWKTIWCLSWMDSLEGWPDHTLLRGMLRFLRSPSVPLGMLVIWLISDKECRQHWMSPKALLLRLGVQWGVFMIRLIHYRGIEALFMLVVVVAGFVMLVVSREFVIVRELSADHCSCYHCKINQVYIIITSCHLHSNRESHLHLGGIPYILLKLNWTNLASLSRSSIQTIIFAVPDSSVSSKTTGHKLIATIAVTWNLQQNIVGKRHMPKMDMKEVAAIWLK